MRCCLKFGHYEQDNNLDNGKEVIEWLVLDYDSVNNRVLLLSRYGLDAKPYNTEYDDVTWEKCTLRTWLNGEFINNAFSTVEQGSILTMTVDNSKDQGYWDINGGNNTQDKIFLLSSAEANKYLGVTYEDRINMKSRTSPTIYALQAGTWTCDYYKTLDGTAAGWWWLRSPGSFHDTAAYVNFDGSIDACSVVFSSACRPALWINLESELF